MLSINISRFTMQYLRLLSWIPAGFFFVSRSTCYLAESRGTTKLYYCVHLGEQVTKYSAISTSHCLPIVFKLCKNCVLLCCCVPLLTRPLQGLNFQGLLSFAFFLVRSFFGFRSMLWVFCDTCPFLRVTIRQQRTGDFYLNFLRLYNIRGKGTTQ